MKNKLLANHEVQYLVEKAKKPPEEVKELLSREVAFWRLESPKLTYDWQLVANQEFDTVWLEYTSVDWVGNPPKLIVPKSKPNYMYKCE